MSDCTIQWRTKLFLFYTTFVQTLNWGENSEPLSWSSTLLHAPGTLENFTCKCNVYLYILYFHWSCQPTWNLSAWTWCENYVFSVSSWLLPSKYRQWKLSTQYQRAAELQTQKYVLQRLRNVYNWIKAMLSVVDVILSDVYSNLSLWVVKFKEVFIV